MVADEISKDSIEQEEKSQLRLLRRVLLVKEKYGIFELDLWGSQKNPFFLPEGGFREVFEKLVGVTEQTGKVRECEIIFALFKFCQIHVLSSSFQ